MAELLKISFTDHTAAGMDLNDITEPGIYYIYDGCTNVPPSNTWHSSAMLVLKAGDYSFSTQIYFSSATGTVWLRNYQYKSSGGNYWGDWKKIQFIS